MSELPAGPPPGRSRARVATPQARKYLVQLCKPFAHKLPATWDEQSGHIAFSLGDCRLQAGADRLELALEAPDPAALGQLQDVVARHLVRFAFRETLPIDWQPA